MKQIVIMPGGFHPFHAGHMALYNSARQAFPNAEVYVAATNDQSERPFPFAVKEKLAKVAGVEPGHFVQVKSPFQAKEITQNYNPDEDVLIFVRSEKDRNESPKPGGTKKDGTPAYFQPYTGKDMQPFGKHAYFAYLPTVKFGPGITSATEIRKAWPTLDDRRKTAMVMSLYPAAQKNQKLAANIVGMLDQVMGGQDGVAEGAPIVVAQAPIDVRNPKKAPQPYRNQGDIVPSTKPPSTEKRGVKGRPGQRPMPTYEDATLSVEELAHISDKALDDAYHYGRSTPGANFGWMANLQSAKAAKRLIDAGETDIEKISDAIHQGWNITAAADYKGQLQLDTPTPDEKKLKRAKLATQSYSQLPEEEKEKDRVVARALLSALGKTNVNEVLNTKPNKTNKAKWSEQTEDLVQLNFIASNGLPYNLSITALYMSPDEIQDSVPEEIPNEVAERGRFVEFFQESKPGAGYGKQGIEGTGAAAEILAIVYNGLNQYVKKYKPTFLMFQAAEPSRRRLYSALVKKILQTMPNWKYTENDGIFFVYDTRYIKQGMEEGFGIPMPGTYEQEHATDQRTRRHHTYDLTSESSLSETQDYLDEK